MKILFYDVKEFEFDYFINHMPSYIEPYFFKHPIVQTTYIDEKYADSEAISVFVASRLDKTILGRFKNLKFIFLRCSGYSNIDLNYCKEKNIKVFNCPNYGASSVAEFAFGLILGLSRKIIKAQSDLKKGEIDQNELTGFELSTKTLGIIGIGHIGSEIARIAKGFNLNTLIYDVNQKNKLYLFKS